MKGIKLASVLLAAILSLPGCAVQQRPADAQTASPSAVVSQLPCAGQTDEIEAASDDGQTPARPSRYGWILSAPGSFNGMWSVMLDCPRGGPSALEVMQMHAGIHGLQARKTIGSACVPVNFVSFWTETPPLTIVKGSTFAVHVLIGEPESPADEVTSGAVTVLDINHFIMFGEVYTRKELRPEPQAPERTEYPKEDLSKRQLEPMGTGYDVERIDPGLKQSADQLSDETANHILYGDYAPDGSPIEGGGHSPTQGRRGKSRFPKGWSDQNILDTIKDVVRDPNSLWDQQTKTYSDGSTYTNHVVKGERGGQKIKVVVGRNGIETAYPVTKW
jgi:hypothetical protein